MAFFKDLADSIFTKAQEENKSPQEIGWEGLSGKAVEDYVTRSLITGGEYDSQSEILHLYKGDHTNENSSVIDIPISVQTPTYVYGIIGYGVRLDGVVHTGENLLMQYRKGRKIEIGIAIRSVADRSGTQTTVQKPFDVTIEFNNQSVTTPVYPISHEYFVIEGTGLKLNIPEGQKAEDIVVWVPVENFFTKSFKNKDFKISFKQLDQETNNIRTYSTTIPTLITNEVINLTYLGGVVVHNNYIQIQFDPSSTDTTQYKLIGFNEDKWFENNPQDMMISNLNSGLNRIQVKAVNINNPDVYTDWYYVDVIYSEGVVGTVVAVNGVSGEITNNGVATLYSLTVYSPNAEEVTITTYLEDEEPSDNPTPTNIIKSEVVNPSQYNIETGELKSEYKKYIEINSDNAMKYLLVEVNGEFYKFFMPEQSRGNYYTYPYLYKALKVESIREEFTYVKTYPTNYNFDQISGYINNVFVTKEYATASMPANISEALESSDGWKENEGRAYFKASAQVNPIFKNPLNLNLGTNFSIELGLKSYNVSDIDKPLLTLGKLQIRPTMVCWDVNRSAYADDAKGEKDFQEAFLKRVSKFQEGVETHIMITVDSNWTVRKNDIYYPDFLGDNQTVFDNNAGNYTHELLRIYINGVIDREVFLESSELTELRNSLLNINPTTADVDFYLFRVYNNNSLNFSEIIKNYISFLPNKTGRNSKEDIYNKNDILGDNGTISWDKCRTKVNTLLFVYPKGGKFPNRFWGGPDGDAEEDIDKNLWTTAFIGYADPNINVKYGGRLNKLQVKGQGSSAMRYLIWNVNSSLNKHKDAEDNKIKSEFTPNGLLSESLIPEDYQGVETLKTTKGKYVMPLYSNKVDTTEYGYTKMVGKVNYASSMQSHKIGACKLFDDAYKSKVVSQLPSGGLKAVHEEPFLYFYIETDLSSSEVAELSWESVLSMADQIKFMGFQTWGPGKGDDTCSGYDEDLTPEYLMLEGGENGDNSVNFLVPWHNLQRLSKTPGSTTLTYNDLEKQPVCTKDESLANPGKYVLIDDESVVYRESGAWDIDYGVDEIKAGKKGNAVKYFKFLDSVTTSPGGNPKSSLQWFREFYDFVYKYDFTFIVEPSTVTSPEGWDVTKKHLVIAQSFYPDGITKLGTHKSYDVYRYDAVNETWVPAGLYYNNETENQWDRLNYRELTELGLSPSTSHAVIRNNLKEYFEDHIGEYVDTNDISFHQAFVKFLSGTDNRAKNTYFQIIGPLYEEVGVVDAEGNPELDEDGEQKTEFVMTDKGDYKIRLLGDDLDTVLATDNNGLQSKAYNLVEDSYDESYNVVWGDLGNIFFRMYDICFEEDIKAKLTGIMTQANISPSSVNSTGTYFYNTFFKVQEDFPAIAYNHTAKIYYENASIIKEVGQKAASGNGYTFDYKHNDVEPIEQSHGSSLECEKQFMKERLAYLAGYANASLDGYMATGRSGGSGASLRLQLDFVPFQDFYPIYQFGTSVDAGYKSFGDLQTVPNAIQSWEDLQTSSITRRQVALKDQQYTVKLNELSSAINQGLYQVNMYKSLSITGLAVPDLSGSFERVTSFEIDNNKLSDPFFNDWSQFIMNSNNAKLPVVQNLNLKSITLPDQLSLLSYHKLQNLDLTGSATKYVEFPQTGNLKTVILPSTITEFRIYNNPGLESVQILSTQIDENGNTLNQEDLSNLKTVYIDCSKCGNLDVEDFCEKLTKVTALEEITLVHADNLKMTESTIQILANKKCRLTGSYRIVDDIKAASPKTVAISFATKEQLVNKFGMITKPTNNTYVIYESKDIFDTNVSCQERINLYLGEGKTSDSFKNAFGLTISDGNNVKLLESPNPWDSSITGKLNITYSMTRNSGVANIDANTGVITITGKSDKEDTITITVVTEKNITIKKTCILVCSWVAPQIGDFAYADGSFSSAYNTSKTLVGLVYNKDITGGEKDTETGTAYIIGKEYSCDEELYTGVNFQRANLSSASSKAKDLARMQQLLQNINVNNYASVQGIDTINGVEVIPSNYSSIANLKKSGKTDTLKYVSHVESFLQALRNKDSQYNQYYDVSTLRIQSLQDLLDLQNALTVRDFLSEQTTSAEDTYDLENKDYNQTVLYPYFYSMYLYEPTLLEGETLNANYTKNSWYAPSIGELSMALYCRGLSVSESFTSANIGDVINPKATHSNAIFTKAYNKMGQDFPVAWSDLLNIKDNITTSVYTTATDNYGYSIRTSGNTIQGGWKHGVPPYEITDDYGQWEWNNDQIWRMYKHKGIPFTHCTYAKPNN